MSINAWKLKNVHKNMNVGFEFAAPSSWELLFYGLEPLAIYRGFVLNVFDPTQIVSGYFPETFLFPVLFHICRSGWAESNLQLHHDICITVHCTLLLYTNIVIKEPQYFRISSNLITWLQAVSIFLTCIHNVHFTLYTGKDNWHGQYCSLSKKL